jgi:hypothetical protein
VCQDSGGGIIKLYNGDPVVIREEEWALFSLDDTPTDLAGTKKYLEEIGSKAENTRRYVVWKLLNDIQDNCSSWYSESHLWGARNISSKKDECH